jgi:nucleoid DNA-binding protein
MATILRVWQAFWTRLQLNQTAQLNEVAEWMSSRTGLNKSEILMVLQELHEGILYFNKQGTPVKLPGIGTFSLA